MQAIAAEAFQRLSWSGVWLGLIHSLWLGLAVASVVALWFQARPRLSHDARYAALVAALGAIAVGPVILTLLPPMSTWWASRPSPFGVQTTVIAAHESTDFGAPVANPRTGRGSQPASASSPRPFRSLSVWHSRMVSVVRRLRPIGLTVWWVSVLASTSVFAMGLRRLNQLRREAGEAPRDVKRRARRLARLLRCRTMPEIRVHEGLDEPFLLGWVRPTVLLPSRWLATAGLESIDAVLAHELAHARRLDHLVNLAQRLVEAALFFHPAVHWLSRSLRRQSELCADALAVRLTGDPLALARALESVARLRLASPTPSIASVMLGGESRFLLTRIQELIGMTPILPRPQRWPLLAAPLAVVIAFVAASVGLAQDEPSPRPPVPPRLSAGQTQDEERRNVMPDKPRQPATLNTEWDRTMSYEVRFIDDESNSCREQFASRGRAVMLGGDVSGWVIDRPMMKPLLTSLLAGRVNLVQAPRVTCLEEATAHVSLGPTRDAGPRSQGGKKPRSPGGIPQNVAAEGALVTMRGSEANRSLRIAVEVAEAWRDSGREAGAGDSGTNRPDLAQAEREVRHRARLSIPEGATLAINLGRRVRRVQSESGPRSVVCDRTVLITPELRQYEHNPARTAEMTRGPAKPRSR